MTAATIGIGGALAALQTASGELPLRAWMEQHYEELVRSQNGKRLRWPALCDWFGSVGLTNARGENPTIKCAKITWYRVGVWLKKRRLAAEAKATEQAALDLQRGLEREAQQESARARREQEEQEQAALRVRMEQAERAAAWQRDRDKQIQQDAERDRAARQQADTVQTVRNAEAALPVSPEGVEFVTLDLPKLRHVSARAYAPFDPTLPPVRDGDLNPKTGNHWKYGDDLPGYPSKRFYEFETDWLWDVGHLLRARHPTNRTMSRAEWHVMQSAKSHHSQL